MAGGIGLSRLAGLIRQRALNHYLGLGLEADAFLAAFRIPNVLQNLLGEGSLSASFIPVYSRLLAAGDRDGARRVAGAVAGALGVLVGVGVLVGIVAAPWLVDVLTPGFEGEKRALTIRLVRILFPGAGLLVLSSWCLGILNSHGRFFLSYAAPVVWNLTIILTVVFAGGRADPGRLALLAAAAAVAGSLLQFAVQLPGALRAAGGVRVSLGRGDRSAGDVRRTFGPALLSRGVAQVSAYVDTMIASGLPTGAVAGLLNAQLLYTLPVSLFGMSIAAAELPAMSGTTGRPGPERDQALRDRVTGAAERVAFFVVPSAAAFMGLGHLVAGLVFQSGRFAAADVRYVWAILAGASVGLLGATLGRLLGSAFFALGDTVTPFRIAALRVAVATAGGVTLAYAGPGWLGIEPRWGVVGLTAASGAAAWTEFLLLRHRLSTRIGGFPLRPGLHLRLWTAAALGVGVGWGIASLTPGWPVTLQSLLALLGFGLTYFAVTIVLGVPTGPEALRRMRPLGERRR